MLEVVKSALRIDGDDLDGEIEDLIDAAKIDLRITGVDDEKILETDPLIKRATILYCKAHFGYDDPKVAERFEVSYKSLKTHLTLSSEYRSGDTDES